MTRIKNKRWQNSDNLATPFFPVSWLGVMRGRGFFMPVVCSLSAYERYTKGKAQVVFPTPTAKLKIEEDTQQRSYPRHPLFPSRGWWLGGDAIAFFLAYTPVFLA